MQPITLLEQGEHRVRVVLVNNPHCTLNLSNLPDFPPPLTHLLLALAIPLLFYHLNLPSTNSLLIS